MSISNQVHELEREFKTLQELHDRTVEFLRKIGDKDPRGGGFIAERALSYLGEPSNYLLKELGLL